MTIISMIVFIGLSMLMTLLFFFVILSGAIALGSGQFSEGSLPVLMTTVNCSGDEKSLVDCHHDEINTKLCDIFEDAAVVCQSEYS